jgi:hypothetical protein
MMILKAKIIRKRQAIIICIMLMNNLMYLIFQISKIIFLIARTNLKVKKFN